MKHLMLDTTQNSKFRKMRKKQENHCFHSLEWIKCICLQLRFHVKNKELLIKISLVKKRRTK